MAAKELKQVCKEGECDNKPFVAVVGKKKFRICCEKGFYKTLEDFKKFLSKAK